MRKKNKSVVNRFNYYGKKDGTFTQTHKLAKKNSEMGDLDRECRDDKSIDDLEIDLYLLNKRYGDTYRDMNTEQKRYERCKFRIVRDWYEYKTIFKEIDRNEVVIDVLDAYRGIFTKTHTYTGEVEIITADVDEGRGRYNVRDGYGYTLDQSYYDEDVEYEAEIIDDEITNVRVYTGWIYVVSGNNCFV